MIFVFVAIAKNSVTPSVKIPTPSGFENDPGGRSISKLGYLHIKRPEVFASGLFFLYIHHFFEASFLMRDNSSVFIKGTL